MRQPSHRTPRGHMPTWTAVAPGLLLLLAGMLVTPALVARLSPDHTLSQAFIERIQWLRFACAILGSMVMAASLWRRGRPGTALLAFAGGLVWITLMTVQAFPGNLLSRPRQLLRAALGQELLLSDYTPKPRLIVPVHRIERAKYPVINIHAHFRKWYQKWTPEELKGILDACNIQALVDLDGGLGDALREEVARYAADDPDRFIIFATFWFGQRLEGPESFARKIASLEEAKRAGARGIKIWKNLGLKTRDDDGRLVAVDDARLDPLWHKAAELRLPILIHVGDPAAFFDPIGAQNERYEELKAYPGWSFYGPEFPPLVEVLQQFERMIARHPDVTFIFAHLGNRTDDLREASGLLDRHPNLLMDISARVSELGRQPKAARDFFITYQDRLLFGTDGNPDPSVYRTYFRFLETSDEYFDYPFWPQFNYGRWKIYGVNLPDEVLRKLYHDNAARLLGLPLIATKAQER